VGEKWQLAEDVCGIEAILVARVQLLPTIRGNSCVAWTAKRQHVIESGVGNAEHIYAIGRGRL
jgi:hypothetical protein